MLKDRQPDNNERLHPPRGAGVPLERARPAPLLLFGPGGDFRYPWPPETASPLTGPRPGRGETCAPAGGGGIA